MRISDWSSDVCSSDLLLVDMDRRQQHRREGDQIRTEPDRILADFALCGVVGEAVNIQTGYLACVSRLLERPLAINIQSSSAAGKSAMMDAVLAMIPSDAKVRYSAMTGQSLFYLGETNFKPPILHIPEEDSTYIDRSAPTVLQPRR